MIMQVSVHCSVCVQYTVRPQTVGKQRTEHLFKKHRQTGFPLPVTKSAKQGKAKLKCFKMQQFSQTA